MSEYAIVAPEDFDQSVFRLIGKEWMLVTAKNQEGKVNTMTASWGGLGVMWGKNVAVTVLRPQRYTKEFIDQSESFTLSFYDDTFKKDLSYLGSVSGRDEDKIAKTRLTPTDAREGLSRTLRCRDRTDPCKKRFIKEYIRQNRRYGLCLSYKVKRMKEEISWQNQCQV